MSLLKTLATRFLDRILSGRPRLAELMADRALRARYGMPVPPTHYYSPLPDLPALERETDRWYRPGTLTGLNLDPGPQKKFLEKLRPYSGECGDLPRLDELADQRLGPGFGEVEARFLYAIVRFLGPRRIIEVGSGFSTYYAVRGLEANRAEGREGQILCVEPYPRQALLEFTEARRITLHRSKVQEMEPGFFGSLGRDDILFIDSSHVSKIDSDVNWLYLNVLPILQRGVVVHVHDIPFPYLTVPPGHPQFRHFLLWNEAALVKAFLLFNEAFQVLLCQSYMHHECPESLGEMADLYDPEVHFPASLWLRKTG